MPEQTQDQQGRLRRSARRRWSRQGTRSINFDSLTRHRRRRDEEGARGDDARPDLDRPLLLGRLVARGDPERQLRAAGKGLELGDTVTLGGKKFTVVGFAKTPLGGQPSDVYVKLAQLQKLSGPHGPRQHVYVRATRRRRGASVVASAIRSSFSGSSVTTAKDLAERVSGSLVDAKNLTRKLGIALEIVGAAGRRADRHPADARLGRRSAIRELGTLKAVGWSQRLVVRQVTGESLLQGLLGGALGIVLGLAGACAITPFGSTSRPPSPASTAAGSRPGPFGQGAVDARGSTDVKPHRVGVVRPGRRSRSRSRSPEASSPVPSAACAPPGCARPTPCVTSSDHHHQKGDPDMSITELDQNSRSTTLRGVTKSLRAGRRPRSRRARRRR